MSQFYQGVTSGALPPSVPTSFATDSGTATPAANIINIITNDSTANNANGIQDVGAGNTVTIFVTNRIQGTATTVGATNADVITFTPTVIGTYAFEVRVAAYNTTSSIGAGYSVFGTARFDGVNSNLCGTPDVIDNEEGAMTGCDATLVVSGANIIIQSLGYAAQTINWSAVGLYTFAGI